jgi:hypothetical protein
MIPWCIGTTKISQGRAALRACFFVHNISLLQMAARITLHQIKNRHLKNSQSPLRLY